jgi:hypothetical protein
LGLWGIGKRAAAVGLAIIGLTAPSAVAQIVFGSPGDPPHIALGGGAFDVTPSHRGNTAAELRAEYRFGDVFWLVSPFIGTSGTSDGAFYGYGGFGVDVNFGPNLVLTPNVAAVFRFRLRYQARLVVESAAAPSSPGGSLIRAGSGSRSTTSRTLGSPSKIRAPNRSC